MYHVMNRGDQRENIFQDDADRETFLTTLGEACQKTDWQMHAYCLMCNLLAAVEGWVGPNHYGAQRHKTALQKAERLIKEQLESG